MTVRLSNPIKQLDNKVLCEFVKGMDVETQEKVLNNYATCLDCSSKFYDERGRKPHDDDCQFCFYKNKNYKLI